MSMMGTRGASRAWSAHIMTLGPVARCDELADDINAVTQLNKNAHRLNLRQKHAIRNGCPSCPDHQLIGTMKPCSFPNILMKTLTIKDE